MLELIVSEYRGAIQDVLVVLICGAALIWGSAPERAVAAVWLIVFEFAGFVYRTVLGNSAIQLMTADTFLVFSDIVAAVLWVGIALYANRNYTLWIAALQLLVLFAHLARGLSDLISPVTYVAMLIAPGWLQLLVLALGLIRHIGRKGRFGPYRDWRKSSTPDQFQRVSAEAGVQDTWIPNLASSWRDGLK